MSEEKNLDTEQLRKRLSHYAVSSMEATGAWAKKRRLATAMREVIDRLVESDAPEDELERAAEGLERYARQLATHPRGHKYEGFAETSTAGSPNAFFDQSPIIGRANPLAPPIEVSADGEVVHGRVNFGAAYEGPPGCVHGGWIAASFDEILGFAQTLTGNPGMTGTLNVVYRKPTPLKTDLRFEARVDRVEGRKIYAVGQVYAGEELTAEATGIFISFRKDVFESLIARRTERDTAGSD